MNLLLLGRPPVQEIVEFPVRVVWPAGAAGAPTVFRSRSELTGQVVELLRAEQGQLEARMEKGLEMMRQARGDDDQIKRLGATWDQVNGRYCQICESIKRLLS